MSWDSVEHNNNTGKFGEAYPFMQTCWMSYDGEMNLFGAQRGKSPVM